MGGRLRAARGYRGAVALAQSVWNRPIDTDLENVYAFISTLPKSTLVAAHPDLADCVPLRTAAAY